MESDEDMNYMDDSDCDDEDGNESDAFEAPIVQAAEEPYWTFTPEQCDALAKGKIKEVCEPLCCEPVVAQLLLRHFKWDSERLTDGYMADPDAVAAKAGVATEMGDDHSVIPVPPEAAGAELMLLVSGERRNTSSLPEITCSICYQSTSAYSALACGHPFCNECYRSFMVHKVADEGHACIFSLCPEPKCKLAVTPQLVQALQIDPDKHRQYLNAASLSFVQSL